MSYNQRSVFPILLIILLLTATNAYANGIPVIFAVSVFHLVVINIFVIIIEIALLKNISRKKARVGFIILANFASIFLAYVLTSKTIIATINTEWFGLDAPRGKIEKRVFLFGVSMFILFTIIIEWPFFHLAQKGNKNWLKSLKFSAIINLLTNIPIALFYLFTNLYYEDSED